MYYLAEYRGMRDPVVVSVNNTSTAATLGRHYGIETHEVPVGFKFIGPKMIETGAMLGAEESGGFGFGMHLPERDGIYADLCLLDLFLRERERGRAPVSAAMAAFHELAGPSFYRRIDVHFDRPSYDAVKQRVLVGLARVAARRRSPASRSTRTQWLDTGDGFKWFLADGSWLLVRASGHRAARPRLHGGHLARAARRARRRRRAAGARRMTDAGVALDKPWGHELIWALTDRYCGKVIVIEAGKRLSLQRHERKDESVLVLSGRLQLHLEDDDGVVQVLDLGPGESRHVPPHRIHRFEAQGTGRARRGLDARARRRRAPRGRLRPRGHVGPLTPARGLFDARGGEVWPAGTAIRTRPG